MREEVTVIMAIAGSKIAEELEGSDLRGLLQQPGVLLCECDGTGGRP
jgi:hypothetical protein